MKWWERFKQKLERTSTGKASEGGSSTSPTQSLVPPACTEEDERGALSRPSEFRDLWGGVGAILGKHTLNVLCTFRRGHDWKEVCMRRARTVLREPSTRCATRQRVCPGPLCTPSVAASAPVAAARVTRRSSTLACTDAPTSNWISFVLQPSHTTLQALRAQRRELRQQLPLLHLSTQQQQQQLL